jgi:hypothetical protein
MSCPCAFCNRHESVKLACQSGDPAKLRGLLLALHDTLAHTEEELAQARAILGGYWPGAVERLENALVKARAVERREA